MNGDRRLWNIGALLMYAASALFLVQALNGGQPLAIVACFLLSVAGGRFLREGSQRTVPGT